MSELACLTCPLPDCQERSIECPLHQDRRIKATIQAIVKDRSRVLDQAEQAVRIGLSR